MLPRHLVREAAQIALILACVAGLHRAFGAFEVEGASMEPTLRPHQYVVVDRLRLGHRPPQRGEVVVFRYPRDTRLEYVKRVIGLPGERITVAHGRVWVNDQPLDEPYLRERPRYFWGPTAIPANTVFVLGDNRNSSSDSHLWGPVPVTHLIGRAWFAYQPMAGWTWLTGQTPTVQAVP